MKDIQLPSGAVLKIHLAPFVDAKALYQAVLGELKDIDFNANLDVTSVFKDIACLGFSSRKIEDALNQCMKRCLYNDMKIDKDTFEPEEARQDYPVVCIQIAQENIAPFMKSLFAAFGEVTQKVTAKVPA